MSMIDCKITVDKKPDPKGDRVVLTMEFVLFVVRFFWELTVLSPFQRKVLTLLKMVESRGNSALEYIFDPTPSKA